MSQTAAANQQDATVQDSNSNCYAAVIENRAKEIGVAVLNLSQLSLHLTQYIEAGRFYTTTQLLLDACQPKQLVIVGSVHHEVIGAVGINHATAAVWEQIPLPRSAFDDTKGILSVQDLTGWSESGSAAAAATSDSGTSGIGRALCKSHYLAFGAAGALLQHVRRNMGLCLAPRSVQVEFDGIKQHMAIDRDAVLSLEILAPTKTHAALQKDIFNTNTSSAAILQLNSNGSNPFAGMLHRVTAPSRPLQGTPGETQGSRAGRSKHNVWPKAPTFNSRTSSLFGFLNHTTTACGARLLRTNVLQPLTDITTLELRLDSLQELLESPHLTLELISLMEAMPKNLDQVCSNLAVRPGDSVAASTRDPSAKLGRLVSSAILLRDVLRCLPVMADSMAWVDSQLLKAIRSNLSHPDLQQLLQETEAVLDDDAQASKAQFVNKVQQCFAVRAQADSFLDISRATFTRLTEAIHELAAKYRASTGIAGLKVQYSSTKGFFMVVPEPKSKHQAAAASIHGRTPANSSSAAPELPKYFLVLEKRGRDSICVTTHELNALNSRLRDAAADCTMLTVQVLERLIGQVLQHMPLLQRILDNIALLDVLLAFFQAVTDSYSSVRGSYKDSRSIRAVAHCHQETMKPLQKLTCLAYDLLIKPSGNEGDFCRPSLSPTGPLAIIKGRHPLLQAITDSSFECRPNDTYISPCCTLHLLTGPNMSGKSTYLKQVALLVVMAQIGCYVPANFMALSPYTSLHTRIGVSDSIEANASSFMVEMSDMALLLSRAGPRSLVLIDELGRATSTADGVALSWSMSEYLLALGAHVLLATHFRQLEELAAIYPSCKLWRMQVDVSGDDIHYSRTIAPAAAADQGANAASHYGILLARTAGLPANITDRALQVAEQLEAKQQQHSIQQQQQSRGSGLRQVYSLIHKLGCVARQAGAEGVLEGRSGPADTEGRSRALPEDLTDAAQTAAAAATALKRCLPMLMQLKQEAEKLVLAAAREPRVV